MSEPMSEPIREASSRRSRLDAAARCTALALAGAIAVIAAAGAVAAASGAMMPHLIGGCVLAVLPAVVLGLSGRGRWTTTTVTWFATAYALLAWIAATDARLPLPIAAWGGFAQRCLLVATCAAIVAAPVSAAAVLRAMALTAAAAAIAYLIAGAAILVADPSLPVLGRTRSIDAVFGHLVWLVTCACPALLAWAAARCDAIEPRSRGFAIASLAALAAAALVVTGVAARPAAAWTWLCLAVVAIIVAAATRARGTWSWRRIEDLTCTVGAIALVAVALMTARRSVVASVVLAAAGLVALAWWQRRRAWALAVAAASSVVVGGAALVIAMTDISRDSERLQMARAALEAARSAFPWGIGSAPALRLHEHSADHGRYLICLGKTTDHVHNEFLEILVEGGPVALLAMLALVAIAAWAAWRSDDRATRFAAIGLGAGLVVTCATENTLATAMGSAFAGAACAALLKMDARPAVAHAGGRAAALGLRWLAVAPAAVACWWAWRLLPAAMLPRGATPAGAVAALAVAPDAYVALNLAKVGGASALRTHDPAFARVLVEAADRSLGRVPWGLGRYQIVDRHGTPAERLAAVGECLRWYPYEEQFYRRLEQIASADATATTAVHDEVRARLAIRAGQAEASGDGPPRTVEAAARHALTALSAIRRGGDCAAVPDLIDGVARRYGHDPNVVNLVLEALATSPDACAQRLLALSDGWRLAALPTAVAAVLIPHYATTTDRARRLAPLLQRLYPDEWTRAGAGDAAGSPLAAALVPVRAAVEQR